MARSQNLLACPFCGLDAEMNEFDHGAQARCDNDECDVKPFSDGENARQARERWNRRAGAGGALNYNRGKRFAPASWLDALATSLERRAKGLEKMSRIDCAEGQMAKTCKTVYEEIAEMIRADTESASNHRI